MSPKRYQGLYRPAAADAYPSQAIVLDCDASAETLADRPEVQRETLTRWDATLWRATGGRVTRQQTTFGDTASSFWYRVDQCLAAGTTTWLFTTPASRNLALVGFWEGLENGAISISGNDVRAGDDDGRGGKEAPGGLCVIEDPPTLILAKRKDRAGLLLIADIRNYGPDGCWPQATAAERVVAQRDWLVRAMSLLADQGLGSWRGTAGSQAVYSFRRKLMPIPLYVHTFANTLKLERAAYYGGRCEAFRIGDIRGPIYHLDIRSLYPWCAWHHDVPVWCEDYHNDPGQVSRVAADLPPLCAADVTVQTDQPDYPYRLAREVGGAGESLDQAPAQRGTADGNLTVWATGRLRLSLMGPELHDAAVQNRVVQFHAIQTYQGGRALAPFMATWYGLLEKARNDGDLPTCQWIKRVMVSLIGKLGETDKRWEPALADLSHAGYASWTMAERDGTVSRFRNVAGYTQREVTGPETSMSVPAVAAWVTSLGRTRLLHLIRAAGRPNVYYCDTDSLMTNEEGYETLLAMGEVEQDTPGKLRVLGVHRQGTILGIKAYRLDNQYRYAGKARGSVSPGPDGGSYWYRQPVSDTVESGFRPEARRAAIAYARRQGYRHGVVGRGGLVTPFHFEG